MKPPGARDATLEPVVSKLERFELHETTSMLYVIACDKMKTQYRMLKIDRRLANPASLADICTEDPIVYGKQDIEEMKEMIDEGNRTSGGLRELAKGHGIVGFVKFLECYYINFITQRRKVGAIGGNLIYTIKAVELFPIKPADSNAGSVTATVAPGEAPNAFVNNVWSKLTSNLNTTPREQTETRYRSLFQCIDLTKDFFYSYTYDLTNSLQHNMTAATSKTFPPPPFKDTYAWNFYQTRELEAQVGHLNSSFWVLPIVHGAFLQRKYNLSGRMLNITVLARRSRHFAGTRYLKRGVSDTGNVANDVEVEQMRGSIPTYWTQESSYAVPKPPIVLSRADPMYTATQAHFADLLERYGSPVLVLDLVKQTEKREREVIVGREYRRAIEHVNSSMPPEHKLRYCALDFSHLSKHRNMNVLKALEDVAQWTLGQIGFFCSAPHVSLATLGEDKPEVGRGVDVWSYKRPRGSLPGASRASLPRSKAGAVKRDGGEEGNGQAVDSASSRAATASVGAQVEESHAQGTARTGTAGSAPHSSTAGLAPAAQPPYAAMPMEQKGVLRTNCIDCLDRTNVAQFSVGVHALGKQLYVMGVSNRATLDSGSQVVLVLMELYSELGDHIALQYGGSEAHKKVPSGSGPSKQVGSMNKHKELLTSIRRYYSNTFTDRMKQDATNVFLGNFIPIESGAQPLWDMESDHYLHNKHVKTAGPQSMREYRKQEYHLDQDEGEAEHDTQPDVVPTSGGGAGTLRASRKVSDAGASSTAAITLSGMIDEDRIAEVQLKKRRVRRMCARQQATMSQWWREALQRYAQKRMWMHLGPPKQGQMPERFVRMHEPHRLTEFDKHFSYEFAVPVPVMRDARLHAAAHGHRTGAGLYAAPDKHMQFPTVEQAVTDIHGEDKSITIGRYVRELSVRARSMLGRPQPGRMGASERQDASSSNEEEAARFTMRRLTGQDQHWARQGVVFIGSSLPVADVEPQFSACAAVAQDPETSLATESEEIREECRSYLKDFTLDTDSAEAALAVQRLAEAHCCTTTLMHGPMKGLKQDISARMVAAAVVEHVERMSLAQHRGLDLEAEADVLSELLEDMGINEDGVRQQVHERLQQDEAEDVALQGLIDAEALGFMTSSLTTEESMDVYWSFFDQDVTSTQGLRHDHPPPPGGKRSLTGRVPREGGEGQGGAATKFVQRDQDLFCSKDNQYMLFNDVGKNAAITLLYGQ